MNVISTMLVNDVSTIKPNDMATWVICFECPSCHLLRFPFSLSSSSIFFLHVDKHCLFIVSIMDRVLPVALNAPIAQAIEYVYSYGPLAEKTVVLGEFVS